MKLRQTTSLLVVATTISSAQVLSAFFPSTTRLRTATGTRTTTAGSGSTGIRTMAKYYTNKSFLTTIYPLRVQPKARKQSLSLSSNDENSADATTDATADNAADVAANDISIEYCTGCRWLLRSTWLMQELFTTFHTTEEIRSITLVPSKPPSPGGTFIIQLNNQVIWDRKENDGFPESKLLKQIIRNIIAPTKSLGHSDSPSSSNSTKTIATSTTSAIGDRGFVKEGAIVEKGTVNEDCVECNDKDKERGVEKRKHLKQSITQKSESGVDNTIALPTSSIGKISGLGSSLSFQSQSPSSPNVRITYCTGCRWMLRSAWMCQELLTTFEEELASVSLVPNTQSPGTFNISIDGELIWERKIDGGFPEIKILKQRVRDSIAPARDLGHVDDNPEIHEEEELDDDSAAELRNFYGVL